MAIVVLIIRGIYPALVIGALSGSGKTYFEFHLAKKKRLVIVFTRLHSTTILSDLTHALTTSAKPKIRENLDAIVMRFVQFYRWAVDELYKMHANERY